MPDRPQRVALFQAFLLFCLIASHGLVAAASERTPAVLILNSYHQGEEWSDKELRGLTNELEKSFPEITPSIEHLDSKRFAGRAYTSMIKDFLIEKYKNRPFDVIIALDNFALDLLTEFKTQLFPGVPVVFAGINNFQPGQLNGRTGVTGVKEFQDIKGTIDLALNLHPQTKRVLFVADDTSSGQALISQVKAEAPLFKKRIELLYNPPAPFADLEKQLKKLPPDSLVLILSYVTDSNGRIFGRNESTRLISKASPVPIYSMHETRLGSGIIGGLLLEGREHGRQAGELALRILAGESPEDIPIQTSRQHPVFDYNILKKFGIAENALPGNSQIINRPRSFWLTYRRILIPAGLTILFLALMIALLSRTVYRLTRMERELDDSREKYRAVVENANEGIVVIQDGRIRYFNRAAADMTGYAMDEFRLLRLEDLAPPPDYRAAREKFLEIFNGLSLDFLHRCRVITKSGELRWLETNTVRFEWEEKPALLVFLTDVTTRKQAEDALEESEKLLRTIADNYPNSYLIIVERDFKIKFASGLEFKKNGINGESFIDAPLEALLRDYANDLKQPVSETFDGGESDFEIGVNGDFRHFQVLPLYQNDGSIPRAMIVAENITERKKSEVALRDSEASLLSLTENTDGSIWALDAGYRLMAGNSRFMKDINKRLGREMRRGECILSGLFPPEACSEWKSYYDRALSGSKFSIEQKSLCSNQASWVEYRFNPIYDENKNVIGLTVFGLDTTFRKRAEEKLKAALNEKEVLLQEIHHRVKNNMQVIISLLRLQAAKTSDQKIKDILKGCQGRVYAMAAAHEALYRSDSLASIEMEHYFTSLLDTLKGAYGTTRVNAVFSSDLEQPLISLKQAVPLGLVFHELVSNSLKHAFSSRQSGQISVKIKSRGDDLALVFSDNGTGFPDGLDWRRADSLGLQIVQNLVEGQLDGQIEYNATNGSTFNIKLKMQN